MAIASSRALFFFYVVFQPVKSGLKGGDTKNISASEPVTPAAYRAAPNANVLQGREKTGHGSLAAEPNRYNNIKGAVFKYVPMIC